MSGVQTPLTIGAVMLLAGVIFSLNNAILGRNLVSYESEAALTATSLAQSLLEEVRTRAFDEKTVPPNKVSDPTYLTSAGNLGAEASEVSTEDFDDVDDYNDFERTVRTSRQGDYKQSVKVYYVRASSLADSLGYQTYLKRVDVRVAHSYLGTLDQSITVSTVVAYR